MKPAPDAAWPFLPALWLITRLWRKPTLPIVRVATMLAANDGRWLQIV